MAAAAPGDRVARVISEARVGLRLDRRLVQLVAADGARVCHQKGRREVGVIMQARRICMHEIMRAGERRSARRGSAPPVHMSQDQKVTAFLHIERTRAVAESGIARQGSTCASISQIRSK